MKHLAGKALTLAGLAVLLVGLQHKAQANDDWFPGNDLNRIAIGFKIAPVPLHLGKRDPKLVGLGSYLVNAMGGCNDCHTNPSYAVGGDPFMGQKKVVNAAHYLAGGMSFGPFISRNLTPEGPKGLPAGRTYAEFKQIIRTGVDLDHLHPQISPLLQVMPWPTYQDMSDNDLQAIYAYLSSIPPATPGP
jgi:hypothetical protein